MEKFITIYTYQSGFYRIYFAYKRWVTDKRYTVQFTDYLDKSAVQKAAQRFIKKGYKVSEAADKLNN